MKQLTAIDAKAKQGQELSKEELAFLYEINGPIEGFGYEKDPRIVEITQTRDVKSDLSIVTGFAPEQISISKEEALKGGIKYHYGDLDLGSLTSAEGLELPEAIRGSLCLWCLRSAEGLRFPESIGGYLYLNRLVKGEGLELPKSIGDSLNLINLTSAEGLKLPESIGGYLALGSLTAAEDLELPKSIGRGISLSRLNQAEKNKLMAARPDLIIY